MYCGAACVRRSLLETSSGKIGSYLRRGAALGGCYCSLLTCKERQQSVQVIIRKSDILELNLPWYRSLTKYLVVGCSKKFPWPWSCRVLLTAPDGHTLENSGHSGVPMCACQPWSTAPGRTRAMGTSTFEQPTKLLPERPTSRY